MTANSSSRSQYTPTESDASIEASISNLAALAKNTQTSDLDSPSSNTDAEKTKVENKDGESGNGKFKRIRRPPPRDTGVIYDRHSDADVEPVSESDFETNFETDSMIPVGDKGKEKSEVQKLLKDSRSTIVLESDGEEESGSESDFINYSTGTENQSSVTGNDNFDKIKDPYQQDSEDSSSLQLTPTSTAEFVTESDSQSIHQISAMIDIDHGSASGEGADANYEAETASQAAAHLDSLDPMNPSVEQDDARRNASIRATLKGLQKSAVTAIFYIFLTIIIFAIPVYLELILHQNDRAYFCDHPSMKTLLNTVLLLLSWEMFVLFDILMKGDLESHEIRCYDAEEIPDVRLTDVLIQLRFHRMRSIVTPLIALIWFWIFASAPLAQFPTCYRKKTCSAGKLGGTNGTANATAVAFVDSTWHALREAVNNATNATVKALINATAQA
ncbi:hypothetical protein BPAE_0046g00450 [Botrytis paeoniae]|uniref:Uncharacterized protein n=1 Tax=Botrytis paeoniae TaxID=278948 RepID=A0A4Z1FW00_9HELO|nr:hypothetical protein BPAE_0046g00450 [Botrytis paeoniae]